MGLLGGWGGLWCLLWCWVGTARMVGPKPAAGVDVELDGRHSILPSSWDMNGACSEDEEKGEARVCSWTLCTRRWPTGMDHMMVYYVTRLLSCDKHGQQVNGRASCRLPSPSAPGEPALAPAGHVAVTASPCSAAGRCVQASPHPHACCLRTPERFSAAGPRAAQ